MSSTVPTKKLKKTNATPTGQGLGQWMTPFLASSVGGKFIVAATGLVLTGFVIGHMAGNLQIFLGQEVYNAYAASLKGMGPLLWVARVVLLVVLLIHMYFSLSLNWKAKQARPVGYAYEQTVQASFASRHMVLTGLVILAFILFHIAHYTLGIVKRATFEGRHYHYLDLVDHQGRHDAYSMMISGFANPIISVLYIIAMVFLFLHLVHGVGSMFQTVGLNSPRAQGFVRGIAFGVALLVSLGNVGIVVGVWAGVMTPLPANPQIERDFERRPPPPG